MGWEWHNCIAISLMFTSTNFQCIEAFNFLVFANPGFWQPCFQQSCLCSSQCSNCQWHSAYLFSRSQQKKGCYERGKLNKEIDKNNEFRQWNRISHKQSAIWQHLSQLKASALSFLQKKKIVSRMKHNNFYLGQVMPSSG